MDLKRPGLPQPVHTDSDGEEKQRAGGREKNRRGNEYLTVTHGVKERNVSLANFLVFFIPPPPLPPSHPFLLHLLTCAPCRLKYASITVWAREVYEVSVFGLELLCGVKSILKTRERNLCCVSKA